tara:strand:- start:3080 stop:4225 length:1146 start_codon:yes stop_codon:yes gene_type:complete
MATTFKSFLNNDITSTRTLLHENIPVTGSIVSGTYNEGNSTSEKNIKNFSHGLFQSVYDYPFLSSSANHIFDITVGYSNVSGMSSSANTQNKDKINMYNQMAQVLMGHDATGSIRQFDEDGNLSSGGKKLNEVFFINFARLLQKDEIKKGTFTLEFGITGSVGTPPASASFDGQNFGRRVKASDLSGSTSYLVNSPAGDYGILYATSSTGDGTTYLTNDQVPVGLVFYQAGIAVVSGSIFNDAAHGGVLANAQGTANLGNPQNRLAGATGFQFISGSSISGSADAIRNRLYNLSFNNTTELNSTVYFCRASHNEFNYSSNPSYLLNSKIRVKEESLDQPVSFITTIGLYSANNELLAVAKTSEPLQKTPDTELVLRVRLDY